MSHTTRRISEPDTDWVKLGMISTDTATFAIVDPCYADVLYRRWNDYLDAIGLTRGRVDQNPNFEEWHLQNHYHPASEYPGMGESAVLFRSEDDGGWDVEGRFADYYRSGNMQLVEVRIRLKNHPHYDDDCGDPECCE
jgi:hypothetical protein